MPRFDIEESQVTSSSPDPGFIPQGINTPVNRANFALAGAAGGLSDTVTNFTVKMKAARDNSAVTRGETLFNTGAREILNELQNRSDFENFDEEFNTRLETLRTEIDSNENISGRARRALSESLDLRSVEAHADMVNIKQIKEMDSYVAEFDLALKDAVKDGDLGYALDLIDRSVATGITPSAQKKALKQEAERKINFVNTQDEIDSMVDTGVLNPGSQKEVFAKLARDNNLNREDTEKLDLYSRGKVEERRREKESKAVGEFNDQLLDPKSDLDSQIETIDALIETTTLSEEKGFALKQRAIRQKELRSKKLEETERKRIELEKVKAELRMSQILNRHLQGETSTIQARDEVFDFLVDFKDSTDSVTMAKGNALFEKLDGKMSSQKEARLRDSLKYINDTLPAGYFGELTPEELKEQQEDLTKAIRKAPTPAAKQKIRTKIIALQNERDLFSNRLIGLIKQEIENNPDILQETLNKSINQFSLQPLESDVFRKLSLMDDFKRVRQEEARSLLDEQEEEKSLLDDFKRVKKEEGKTLLGEESEFDKLLKGVETLRSELSSAPRRSKDAPTISDIREKAFDKLLRSVETFRARFKE